MGALAHGGAGQSATANNFLSSLMSPGGGAPGSMQSTYPGGAPMGMQYPNALSPTNVTAPTNSTVPVPAPAPLPAQQNLEGGGPVQMGGKTVYAL